MAVNIDLSNKIAVVTGGTRGIGKAIGERFLEAGAHVILTGTSLDEIQKLNIKNNNPKLAYRQLDLLSENSVNEFLVFISNLEAIHILVNNAGINIVGPAEKTLDEDFLKIQKINLEGPYKLCKEAGKKMIAQEWGRIVNIASIWSVVTRPGRSIYCSSKMGILGLTKTLSVEWAKHNVLVNAVSPGFTLTELTYSTNSAEDLERITQMIPQNRMALPEEMANGVLFLASNLNTYISGQNLIIDGGYTDV